MMLMCAKKEEKKKGKKIGKRKIRISNIKIFVNHILNRERQHTFHRRS